MGGYPGTGRWARPRRLDATPTRVVARSAFERVAMRPILPRATATRPRPFGELIRATDPPMMGATFGAGIASPRSSFHQTIELRENDIMHRRLCNILVAGVAAVAATGAGPVQTQQDSPGGGGFVSLFNGKDLSGWHGLKTMDPRKFAAMGDDEKAKALEQGAEDQKKHWRVEDGV